LYIGLDLKPHGQFAAPQLAAVLPERDAKRPQTWSLGPVNWYDFYCGSLVRFLPLGGRMSLVESTDEDARLRAGPPTWARCFGRERVAVEGSEWTFFGISPVPTANNWGHRGCICQKIGFDLDGFERVFVPDVLQCRVHVLDSRGNLITSFGRYGNADSAASSSAIPFPEIPLAWAPYLAVAGRDVYLSDKLNRRVVHVRLSYAAEAARPM
jgi:hypothetical protein